MATILNFIRDAIVLVAGCGAIYHGLGIVGWLCNRNAYLNGYTYLDWLMILTPKTFARESTVAAFRGHIIKFVICVVICNLLL